MEAFLYDEGMFLGLSEHKLPRAVYGFALLGFALRLAVRLHSGAADFWENSYYFFFPLAQNIAQGNGITEAGGVPTAFRVPFYPIVLAGITLGHQAFWPIVIAQSLIGAGTVVLAGALAVQIFGRGARAAQVAACAVALYPYYVIHDTALQETSLFTLLTLAAVVAMQHAARGGTERWAALGGVLLGLDTLTRATIAPFALLAPLWLMRRKNARTGLLCLACAAVVVSPWLWRNYRLTGSPVLSSEGGVQLWTGNNGYLFHFYPEQSSDLSKEEALNSLSAADQRELEQLRTNEVNEDRWYRARALAYIEAHPGETAVNGLRKIAAGFYWLPSPRHGRVADLVYAASYLPVMLAGLWGMWRRRGQWREDFLIYALYGTFALLTAVFWAHTSHRVYLDVYWMVLGAGALTAVGGRRAAVQREPGADAGGKSLVGG